MFLIYFFLSDTSATLRYYADLIVSLEQEKKVNLDEGVDVSIVVRREPIGVCGLIVPWNYPLLMAAWKVRETKRKKRTNWKKDKGEKERKESIEVCGLIVPWNSPQRTTHL